MSKITRVYLDGVACMGKTTICSQLDNMGVSVGLFDLTDFFRIMGPGSKREDYIPWFKQRLLESNAAVIDRSPIASFLYPMMFNGSSKTEMIEQMKKINLNDDEIVFMILPTIDSYNTILNRMKKRNNQLDILNIDYIKIQYEAFYTVVSSCPDNIRLFIIDTFTEVDFAKHIDYITLEIYNLLKK